MAGSMVARAAWRPGQHVGLGNIMAWAALARVMLRVALWQGQHDGQGSVVVRAGPGSMVTRAALGVQGIRIVGVGWPGQYYGLGCTGPGSIGGPGHSDYRDMLAWAVLWPGLHWPGQR